MTLCDDPCPVPRRRARVLAAAGLATGLMVLAVPLAGTASAAAAAPAWYVSFHGSSPSAQDGSAGKNNLYSYAADGTRLSKAVLPDNPPLSELRGMITAPDGSLYVANATETDSEVLHYEGSGSSDDPLSIVPPDGVFVDATGLDHPYGLALTPGGTLLVSSQGSGDDPTPHAGVIQYQGVDEPSPTASTWAGIDGVPDGTLVPSADAAPGGGVTGPRAIALVPAATATGDPTLYVADDLGSAIRTYDAVTGAYLGAVTVPRQANAVQPVGLVLHDGRLYVSDEGNDTVLVVDTDTDVASVVVPKDLDAAELDHPSGVAFGADGRLYVNSRVGQQINAYTLDSTGTTATAGSVFIAGLPDQPEELLPVTSASVTDPTQPAPGTSAPAPASPPAVATPPAAGQTGPGIALAATGPATTPLAAWGVGCLAAGSLLLLLARRRQPAGTGT